MAAELNDPWFDLDFMAPLSDARAARLVEFLTSRPGKGAIVDLGCGWGELLLRAAAGAPDRTAVGIDSDERAIGHARSLVVERGLADGVEFVVGSPSSGRSGWDDAVINIGASHAFVDPHEPEGPIDYVRALAAIRARLPRGGRAVYAEGVWTSPPTDAACAALGGDPDELKPIADVVGHAVETGFAIHAVHEADQDEWDAFESGYTRRYATWLAAHDPNDPDAADVRERARRQQEGYLRGYRGVLGFAYLELVAI